MTKQQLIDYVDENFSVKPEFLWKNSPDAIFRVKGGKKWFGVIMEVESKKIAEFFEKIKKAPTKVDVLNVKIDPIFKTSLLEKEGIFEAWHMNKNHWVSIVLGHAEEEDIKTLLEMSYALVEGIC